MKKDIILSANILFMFVCLLFAFGLKSYSLFLTFVFIAFVGNVVTKLVINRLNR